MKKIFATLLILPLCMVAASQINSTQFLFDEFASAVVYLKNGQQTMEKININMVDGMLYFIDKNDNRIKVVAGVENLHSLRVDGRQFLISETAIREIVHKKPLIYIQYAAKSRPKETTVGYGGSSMLTSTTNYSRLQSNGDAQLSEQERVVTDRYCVFWIVRGGKEKKFDSLKQFLKIYPKDKRELLIEYAENESVDFDDVDKIIALCLYAESLVR